MLAGMTEEGYGTSSSDVNQLLVVAANSTDTSSLKRLLVAGSDLNAQNEIGQTPLLAAALNNNVETCRLLIERGADVHHCDVGGYTALHLTSNADITEMILQYDRKYSIVNAKTKHGRTPLHEAVIHGSLDRVNCFIKHDALVDALDEGLASPLHYASCWQDQSDLGLNILDTLIKAGANVNRKTLFLKTPLILACSRKMMGIGEPGINRLLDYGAVPTATDIDGNNALHALLQGVQHFLSETPVGVVDRLVKEAPQLLTTANKYGEHPIHIAYRKCLDDDKCAVIRHLINIGADVHSKDNLGRTILHLCCQHNVIEETGILADYPSLINEVDCLDRTALHYSVLFSNDVSQIEEILRMAEFKKMLDLDTFGLTAIDYALKSSNSGIRELFERFRHTCKSPVDDRVVTGDSTLLGQLLTQMVVETTEGVLAEALRPVDDAQAYVMDIWKAGAYPTKNPMLFIECKQVVERFMHKLIDLIREKDERFYGHLIKNGSSYEETKTGDADEYDFLLQLDAISSLCRPLEIANDPPGYTRVLRVSGKDLGIYADLFEPEGFIKTEKVMSRFSQIVMEVLHDPRVWASSGLDFTPNFAVKWKSRPALTISCTQRFPCTIYGLSIDFLPALYFADWWPSGTRDDFIQENDDVRNAGCHLIIKPVDVPHYQHAQFGIPRHLLRITFSMAETVLFNMVPSYIRKCYMIVKYLVTRDGNVPIKLLYDDLGGKMQIIGKNAINSYFIKQCLLREVMEKYPLKHPNSEEEGNLLMLTWVQTIVRKIQESYEEGNLPYAFMPIQNLLYTFQPAPDEDRMRYIQFQLINHSLAKAGTTVTIKRGEYKQRWPSTREMRMHGKLEYFKQMLQAPEER